LSPLLVSFGFVESWYVRGRHDRLDERTGVVLSAARVSSARAESSSGLLGGLVSRHVVGRFDQAAAQEVRPQPVGEVLREVRVLRVGEPVGQFLARVARLRASGLSSDPARERGWSRRCAGGGADATPETVSASDAGPAFSKRTPEKNADIA